LYEDGSDAGTLAPVHLQLGPADGTEQVPVALGGQRPAHRRQVGTARQRRVDWPTVDVDCHQTDHVQTTTGCTLQPRRLPSPCHIDYVSSCGFFLMPVVYQVVGFGRGFDR